MAGLIEIEPKPPADVEDDDIEFIGDLETIVETARCSCSAGDDNPY